MNEPTGMDWRAIVLGLLSVVTGIMSWIANRSINRIDKIEQEQRQFITREEFTRAIEKTSEERQRMHVENGVKLDRIHQRLDDFYTRDQQR